MGAEFVGREVVDVDDLHDFAVVLGEPCGVGAGDDAECLRLGDHARHLERTDTARLDAVDPDALFEVLRPLRHLQHFLQQSERIVRGDLSVDRVAEPVAYFARRQHELGERAAEPIIRCRVLQTAREDEETHQGGERAVREVAQEAVQLVLRFGEQAAAGPLDDRQVFGTPALVVVVLEHHRGEVHAGEHIAEPRREVLFLLQVAAEREHRDIHREREAR